jgi:3-dehydroquinate synthase
MPSNASASEPLLASEPLVVNLGPRTYPLYSGRNLRTRIAAEAEALQAAGGRLAVVTDTNLERSQMESLDAMMPGTARVVVEPGEKSKSLETLGQVLDFMAAERLDRRSVLVAVGGGVVGDLAGFAAAAYLRGIAFWQVPTTLLAMVDSSVGGKTGINLAAGKNLVGAFHQPARVFIDTAFLDTLPPREFAAGMAEVIKYGLLGDAELFVRLEREPLTVASADLAEVIRRCCAAKARVVEADEFERAAEGGRALLNLGHTFGHAIEQVTGYGAYLHGEAVAVGLAAAARLSRELGLIGASDVGRIDAVLTAHGLPTRLRAPLPWTALREAMGRDKKVRAGRLRFVVLESFGVARTRDDVPEAPAETAFREVGAA